MFGVFVVFKEGGTGGGVHQTFAQGVTCIPGSGGVRAPRPGQVGAPPACSMWPLPPIGATVAVGGGGGVVGLQGRSGAVGDHGVGMREGGG